MRCRVVHDVEDFSACFGTVNGNEEIQQFVNRCYQSLECCE